MSLAKHTLYLRSPTGGFLDIIPDQKIASISYSLKVNEPGVCDLSLSGDYPVDNLYIDGQFEIERSYAGGSPKTEGDTAFFIRSIDRGVTSEGTQVIFVTAISALGLMDRRIVAYYAGTSYSDKQSEHWDDMLREIVKENYGSLAVDTARNLSPWLTIENDKSVGVSYQRSMPWDVVGETLQAVVNDVRSKGTYCTYDVIMTGPATYEFRIFIGPRGMDHSSTSTLPVIISEDRRNLSSPHLVIDWTEEKNVIYATGQGQEENRVVKTALDTTRIGISPFNRQEFQQDSRSDKLDESVQAEANAALEEHRPKQTFTGNIMQTEGCIYGVHWGWGDIVTAEFAGMTFDCYVETVTVTVDQSGTEIAVGNLRSVKDVG